jgi:hypothetical protein
MGNYFSYNGGSRLIIRRFVLGDVKNNAEEVTKANA